MALMGIGLHQRTFASDEFAYKPKKDVWSFGVTALEIVHGCPPVSHIPPSESLIMKTEQRFQLTKQELMQRSKESEDF